MSTMYDMHVMFAAILDIKLRCVAINAYRGKIFHGFQPRFRRLERRDRGAPARRDPRPRRCGAYTALVRRYAGRRYARADGGVGEGAETASCTDTSWYLRTRGGPEGEDAESREPASIVDELSARAESASGRGAAGRRV
jgi:hypothetical protein